jgi:tRNA(Ile2) C34 agmatinyltransferase TiaS
VTTMRLLLRLNEKGYFETRVNAAIHLVAERP